MQQLASYLSGAWQTGRGRARTIHHAISGAVGSDQRRSGYGAGAPLRD
jgi:hypothetical protein